MKMKSFGSLSLVMTVALLLTSGAMLAQAQNQPVTPAAAAPDPTRVAGTLQSTSMMFAENIGQFAPDVRFQVRSGDRIFWLAEDALWVTVLAELDTAPQRFDDTVSFPTPLTLPAPAAQKGVNIKLSFDGANLHPRLVPFKRLDTRVSYFTGNAPAQWRPDVPVWGGVRYVDLYPGIDLEIAGENTQMAPRLVVHPGADLSAVRLQVDGADTLALEGGALHLTTAVGEFALPLLQVAGVADAHLARPTITGDQIAWPFAPTISQTGSTTDADPQSPIANQQSSTSDLLYSTLLGGWSVDDGLAIAVDGSGSAYVAGSTLSWDFPTTSGAFETTYSHGGHDAFVAKLNPAGSGLVYATFLGGSKDECNYGGYPFVLCSLAVDEHGNAYIAGLTLSADFPTTPGAFSRTPGGGQDIFVTRLNASGTALVYSTFLGGTRNEYGYAIAVDEDKNAYVTGATASLDFPTTPDAYDTTTTGSSDAFIVKLNPAGSALRYATFLGGDDDLDSGRAIALDESWNVYVTGVTCSGDFPTTPGALKRTLGWTDCDAFVTKLNPSGAALVYSTFLGGADHEWGNAIAVDLGGAVYVAGHTESADFPTPISTFDTTYNGGNADAFVAKLDPAGSALLYATYLGGISYEQPNAIAVDSSGAAYIAGRTNSADFPTTPRALDTSLGGTSDAFITKLNAEGSALVYSTFLGGSTGESYTAFDHADGIVVDSSGNVYVTGATECDDFPTTTGAFDTTHNGSSDAFVAKLAFPSPHVDAYVQAPALVRASPGNIVTTPIQYGNRGASTAASVTLTATLSSGLTYVGDTSGRPPTLNSNTVTWNLADLAFRDNGQFVLQVRLSGTALSGARYPVTLTLGSAGIEDGASDNTARLEVLAVRPIYLPLILNKP